MSKNSTTLIHGKEYWLRIAQNWRQVQSPVRPSLDELKIYDQFLHNAVRNLKALKILVLGATPELRDLAAKYTKEVTVVDANLEMILAMTALMKSKNNREIWAQANWLTMPLSHNYYDVILGDAVVSNVTWRDAHLFWKHLAEVLKPNGKFITRIFVYRPLHIVNIILNRIKARGKANRADCTAMHIIAQYLYFDHHTKTTSNPSQNQYYRIFQGHPWAKRNKVKIYNAIKKIFPPSKKLWRVLTSKEVAKEVSCFFKIIDQKFPSHSLFDKVLPIYLLKKK